ncbi:hypothetical protein SLEP1_g3412 [Rubroshorea leprosula]|uniref:CNNM transmembrane domain-containing protein n=1 Tax=Rubroshorea leprosula TaxID=152421 RepID=A0AAV5HU11_9ROSI|nr:hypothetical protein SLEP1_g3412 [Rubroshorea leprosula]
MAANDVPCCETMFWVYLVICVALVCFAGLMSGLTLGLMSLSLVDLEVLTKAGQPQDQKNAEKILPLVKNQHLLLCTLLIGNSLAMEALPIFLDALLPAWASILISVTLILTFGEIIPQAVCSRYGLSVGAKLSPLVRLIVIVLFPLSYPISKLLDFLLGKRHSALLRRAELKTLVDLHGNEAGKGGELTHHETTIITGALDMTQKTAIDAMTPISKVFSLDINAKLDEYALNPALNPSNIHFLVTYFYVFRVKNLIKSRPEDDTPIRNLTIRNIPKVHDRLPLYDILNQFQKGHSHMAVVVKYKDDLKETTDGTAETKINIMETKGNEQVYVQSPTLKMVLGNNINSRVKKREHLARNNSHEGSGSLAASSEEVLGIITLEDIMEELLQEEILDETDEYVDVHNKITINMKQLSIRSPSRSPAAAAHFLQRSSPRGSPLSSDHESPLSSRGFTPVLHSPISPYAQSPLIRPTLSASPSKTMLISPPGFPGVVHGSPSQHQVSRKSYEKLRQKHGS